MHFQINYLNTITFLLYLNFVTKCIAVVSLYYEKPNSAVSNMILENVDPKSDFTISVEEYQTEVLNAYMDCYSVSFGADKTCEVDMSVYAFGNQLTAYPARWVNFVCVQYVC